MNTEELAYINDFIEIETNHGKGAIETSQTTGVEDFFYSHLEDTNINETIKLHGIDVYRLQVGDTLKLSPSKWAIEFSREKGLDRGEEYEYAYKVKNINIDFYSLNPRSDSKLPMIFIKLILERL